MMVDKADIESGLYMRWNKPLPHWAVVGHPASKCEASRERPDLNLFEAFMMLEFRPFQHFADCVCDLVNATAPYFIHIVRANRARDMIGRCPGICQTGQHEEQTVAG